MYVDKAIKMIYFKSFLLFSYLIFKNIFPCFLLYVIFECLFLSFIVCNF